MGIGKINKMMGMKQKLCTLYSWDLGFRNCIPSRHVSAKHDNAKIDFNEYTFNVLKQVNKQT
jgi:hypothetical protein